MPFHIPPGVATPLDLIEHMFEDIERLPASASTDCLKVNLVAMEMMVHAYEAALRRGFPSASSSETEEGLE